MLEMMANEIQIFGHRKELCFLSFVEFSLCIRSIYDNLEPLVILIGHHRATSTTEEPVALLRVHSYVGSKKDAESVMKGKKPLAIFVHGRTHCTHLVTKECCDDSLTARNAVPLAQELSALLSKSIKAKT
ncbi:hypothetical protein PR048_016401 [Dryococelus australis]|uniref:Uncharacterized protein n=1 Tax=Dryococelus australis TaxID=614101 RepID=A0ABQ9HK22_9NEOP|nr:hypothetical protein PR048_016401 [Dryococelus australis]